MPEPTSGSAAERRAPRADARRNRERILAAAREAFAVDGPSVSLDEIARRAGLGAGTVHRHFPTKEELLTAVVADRLRDLAGAAEGLADAADAGEAFVAFFHRLVGSARQHLALAAAFTTPADVGVSVRDAGTSLAAAIEVLLARAQQAGAIRSDIGVGELHAIIAGAVVIEQRLPTAAARGRGIAVIVDGLRGAAVSRAGAAATAS